ncbi:MAG: oxidoreductase [Opitutales bacterium]|nr:oxidoreductase [Opitutales bacterium]
MDKPNISWLGTGVMGVPMATHLLQAGYEMRVFSRTRAKAEKLLEMGAQWADSPAEAAEASQVVLSMLGYPEEVEEALLGENGVRDALGEGGIVVDMTTSSPDLALRIAREMERKKCFALDAPVSGGDVGAKNASLAIMCGGAREVFEQALPILEVLGERIRWFGEAGSGQRVKMANQILIASTMIGTVESLLYAQRSNLDLSQVIDLIGQGAAGCWSLNQLGPRMVRGDWAPGFYIKHFIKDMGIAMEDSKRMGLDLKGLELAMSFYKMAREENYEEDGTQALFKVLSKMNP